MTFSLIFVTLAYWHYMKGEGGGLSAVYYLAKRCFMNSLALLSSSDSQLIAQEVFKLQWVKLNFEF